MKFKKRYTLLYMPDDHQVSRQLHIPWWGLVLGGALVLMLGTASVLYAVGLAGGTSWLPGGSRLAQENLHLRDTIAGLQEQVGELQDEIEDIFAVQGMVAGVMNLEPLDADLRGGVLGGAREVPALDSEAVQTALLGDELQHLLEQARIQRRGYAAMLDTLAARAEARECIPSIRPTDIGWLSSRFGFRRDPFTGKQTFHRGLDFSVPVGTDVRVTGDGVVAAVQQQRGFGRVVKVDHGDGVMTVYAHLDQALVKKGAKVRRGDIIARSGNSGRSSAPHLHYEIRLGDRPVNPLTYILDSYAARR